MKLYVVIGGWDYETCEVIGIYDSREKAEDVEKEEDRLEKLKRKEIPGYDYVEIEEMNLNERREG